MGRGLGITGSIERPSRPSTWYPVDWLLSQLGRIRRRSTDYHYNQSTGYAVVSQLGIRTQSTYF